MPKQLRPWIWPLVVAVLAIFMYGTRVHSEMVDFAVYHTAAARAIEGEPLYRPEDGHYQFKYLPAFALALTPFAAVPISVARAVWFALSVVLLWFFVARAIEHLPAPRRSAAALAWLAVLLMGKFYAHELNLGQTIVLLGLVLVSALAAVQNGQAWRAGALVGAGIFVKPYAVILLPWLLPAAGLTAVLAAGTVMAAGLAAPIVTYGWQGNLDQVVAWYRTVTDTTAPNLLQPENVSLATMWAKWIGVGPPATALALATAAAAGAVVVWVIARRGRVGSPAYLEFGLLMLLVPLLSPQGWDYVLLLGTPAILCIVDRYGEMTWPWRVGTGAAVALMSFTIFDVLGRALYARLMAVSVVTVAALVLLVSLAHLRRRALA